METLLRVYYRIDGTVRGPLQCDMEVSGSSFVKQLVREHLKLLWNQEVSIERIEVLFTTPRPGEDGLSLVRAFMMGVVRV